MLGLFTIDPLVIANKIDQFILTLEKFKEGEKGKPVAQEVNLLESCDFTIPSHAGAFKS